MYVAGANQVDAAVVVLDQGRATLHPVAAVEINHAVVDGDLRSVDMTANQAVNLVGACFPDNGFLEVGDELDCIFHPVLEESGQRPVVLAHFRARPVDQAVEPEQVVVELGADQSQQGRADDCGIELVAVHHQEAAAVGGLVNDFIDDLDVADHHAAILAHDLVVVARDEHHPGIMLGLAQQRAHHVAVALRPVALLLQVPEVDDVADQVERLATHLANEIEQVFGAAAGKAQMNVGNPDAADIASEGDWLADIHGAIRVLHDAHDRGWPLQRHVGCLTD